MSANGSTIDKTREATISVFGLGKVGVTLVAALGAAGYRVIGVDVVEAIVETFNNKSFSTREPGVMERLACFEPGQFTATLDEQEAAHQSSISFVIVPTPSNSLDGFSNEHILKSLRAIGVALRRKSEPHHVSVISTVLPLASEVSLIPALEQASSRKIGNKLGYCYNPSFIAQGEVMKGIIEPDFVLIGEADPVSGDSI